MGPLVDGTGLGLIDLPLIRYTRYPYGADCDAWPPYMDDRLREEKTITGWEVWCEATEMRGKV